MSTCPRPWVAVLWSLHEHAAFGAVLSNGGRVLVNLSPGRLLGDPLEAASRAGALELRPMHAGHRRQGGDVEYITDAVLRIFGGALSIGHGSNLPRQISALGRKERENQSVRRGNK